MANKRIALFQGSFDPFTRGHESIVMRALSIFDEVVIAVVHNSQKHSFLPVDLRVRLIEDALKGESRVKVVCSEGLTVNIASHISSTIVRELLKFDKEIKDHMPEHLSIEMLEKVKTFKP